MTMQIIEQGPRNLIVKFMGAGPDTVTVASLSPACRELRIMEIIFDNPDAGSATLTWDATVPVVAWQNNGHAETACFKSFGGLTNNSGAGKTGNVIYAGAATTSMVVHFRKVEVNPVYN